MIEHLSSAHDVNINQESREFASFEEFMKWKAIEEAQTHSFYVQQSGSRVRGTGTWWYFYCNRSGHYQPKGSGKRMLKSQGSAKIDGVCTAHMTVRQDNSTGHVTVHYCSSHHCHEKEIAHLRIPEHVRLSVASKLQQGVAIERILDDIRDSVAGDFGREHLTNRQDVRNVLNQYNIRGIEKHANDHSSVSAWITELRSPQEFDPILFFKQQGDEAENLEKEDFLLCMQTEFQLEMIKAFGNKVICIDATHSTNMYDFLLITVLIVDEFGEGVPVGWAISNREDTSTLSLFLEKLRIRTGELKPDYFMSDDAQQYWNAWAATYGTNSTTKLLCTWHVDRAWRKALQEHIGDTESRPLVYHQLRLLLSESDKVKFNVLLQQFLSFLMTNHSRFFEYFRGTYALRCSQWATCHRIGTIVNTNMHLESFHRLLKVVYLQGKQNRRLDHLISIILKVARDKGFERLQKLHKGKTSHRACELNKRHKKADEMMSSGVSPTLRSATTWEVPSQSNPHSVHVVQAQTNHNCTCKLVCGGCKVCAYAYTCTCVDYALHNTACKHMHLIHMIMMADESEGNTVGEELEPDHPGTSSSTSTSSSQVSDASLQHILQKTSSTIDIQRQLVVSKANEVLVLAKSIESAEGLQTASRHLSSAISILKTLGPEVPKQVLPCRKRPAPNARMETQVRYHSTKRKRTKSSSLTKPSTAQTIQAKEILEGVDVRLCSVCLREDDEEHTEEVEWLQCTRCNVWVHTSCIASSLTRHPSLCNICNSV